MSPLGSGGLGATTLGNGDGFSAAAAAPTWSFITAASVSNTAAATAVTGLMKPNVGDLCVIAAASSATSAVPTSASVSDTGSSGWNVLEALATNPTGDFGDFLGAASWWKIATAADFNSGSGVTITVTMAGQTGSPTSFFECDVFRLSSGSVTGLDLAAILNDNVSATSKTLHPAAGSSQPSNRNELAWTAFLARSANMTGTNTFTGTSATANLSPCLTQALELKTQFVGGVQASATAASNTWVNTSAANRKPIMTGATFY